MKRNAIFFSKVSEPSNPSDELAQHVSKNPFRTDDSSFFFISLAFSSVLNCSLDSNSILRAWVIV